MRHVDRPAIEADALDCWSHGLTHLISTFGLDCALQIASRSVLDIVDNRDGLGLAAARLGDPAFHIRAPEEAHATIVEA